MHNLYTLSFIISFVVYLFVITREIAVGKLCPYFSIQVAKLALLTSATPADVAYARSCHMGMVKKGYTGAGAYTDDMEC